MEITLEAIEKVMEETGVNTRLLKRPLQRQMEMLRRQSS